MKRIVKIKTHLFVVYTVLPIIALLPIRVHEGGPLELNKVNSDGILHPRLTNFDLQSKPQQKRQQISNARHGSRASIKIELNLKEMLYQL